MLTGSITLLVVLFWGLWILGGGRLYRESRAKVMLTMVFVFYISLLLAATLFPLPLDATLIEQQRALADNGFGPGNNFVPFETLRDASRSEARFISQIGGNFLLLVPLGFLAPLIWDRFARLRNGVILVVATTLAIEFTQLGISEALGFTYRSFDVDDLWLNALGGTVGVLAAMMVRHWIAAAELSSATAGASRDSADYMNQEMYLQAMKRLPDSAPDVSESASSLPKAS